MATYKVIQDIEAEDKLLGPLSLRQFIYACIGIGFFYLTFLVVSSGLPIAAIVFLPPGALFCFLAFPWKGDQPTEVWALAKIQFLTKPRKRIWNQSGVKELVTITAPKRIERIYSNGLSQTEVRSRLKALADTIDSRGWVIKNVPVGYGQQTGDRLLPVSTMPQQVAAFNPQASDDMLDLQNNPTAQKFDSMIAASQKAHRDEIMARMNAPDVPAPPAPMPAAPAPMAPTPIAPPAQQPNNYWFLNQPAQAATNVPADTVTFNTQVVAPGATATALPINAAAPTADEEAFIRQHSAEAPLISPNMHGHLHVIKPLSEQAAGAVPQQPLTPAQPVQQMQPVQAQNPAPADSNANGAGGATNRIQAMAMAAQPMQQAAPAAAPVQQQVTPAPDAGILDLARNDDLNVATLAREAQKRKEAPDEVVISLH